MHIARGIGQIIQQNQRDTQAIRTRLAPTPSGFLHRGNLYNIILNWWLARACGGIVLLRIDDLDKERVRTAYVDFIFRCFAWLELDWDEGPSGPDDLSKNWSQEHRMPLYRAQLEHLMQLNLVYPCTCSRNSLSIRPCSCKLLRPSLSGLEFSFKLALPEQPDVSVHDALNGKQLFSKNRQEDPIVWKKNDTAAYHLGSLTDDLHFGVSHILRGEDLIDATLIQTQMAKLAGLTAFEQIRIGHHPLLKDSKGGKLSKSAGSQSVMPELQQNPARFLREFATWAGIPEANDIQRLRDILQIAVDKS